MFVYVQPCPVWNDKNEDQYRWANPMSNIIQAKLDLKCATFCIHTSFYMFYTQLFEKGFRCGKVITVSCFLHFCMFIYKNTQGKAITYEIMLNSNGPNEERKRQNFQ